MVVEASMVCYRKQVAGYLRYVVFNIVAVRQRHREISGRHRNGKLYPLKPGQFVYCLHSDPWGRYGFTSTYGDDRLGYWLRQPWCTKDKIAMPGLVAVGVARLQSALLHLNVQWYGL
jgi:hypothetical protein